MTDMIMMRYPETEAVLDFEKKVEKKKHRLIKTFPQSKKNRINSNALQEKGGGSNHKKGEGTGRRESRKVLSLGKEAHFEDVGSQKDDKNNGCVEEHVVKVSHKPVNGHSEPAHLHHEQNFLLFVRHQVRDEDGEQQGEHEAVQKYSRNA